MVLDHVGMPLNNKRNWPSSGGPRRWVPWGFHCGLPSTCDQANRTYQTNGKTNGTTQAQSIVNKARQHCNPASLHPCTPCTPAPLHACNHGTLQRCNAATFQPCNPATLQPCNLATMQPCNPATLQPCNHATLQPCNPATQQPCASKKQNDNGYPKSPFNCVGFIGWNSKAIGIKTEHLAPLDILKLGERKKSQLHPNPSDLKFELRCTTSIYNCACATYTNISRCQCRPPNSQFQTSCHRLNIHLYRDSMTKMHWPLNLAKATHRRQPRDRRL